MYTLEDGTLAVRLARRLVDCAVRGEDPGEIDVPEAYRQKTGIFVTLNTFPEKELRGCIGFPEPVFRFIHALIKASRSAALSDPRFPSVRPEELDRIVIEVSILTPPELIKEKGKKAIKHIEIGRDGLIIERGYSKGLLLPQVPVEWNWGVEEFLSHTCSKAMLPPSAWMDRGTNIYKFTAEIFGEKEPYGEIEQREISGS